MLNELNEALSHALDHLEDSTVKQAMRYSLEAGGKRLRPMLVLSACESCGYNYRKAMPAAIALEMIHTYSLIHDDLPAMDNDDLRRGRLTCHRQFDEATAILAGDGLLTEAFYQIAKSELTDRQKLSCIEILSHCAGSNGMVLGQVLDMEAENKAIDCLDDLKKIHINKTGQLFSAALQMGCIIGEKTDFLSTLDQIGKAMGIAFQIQDDILDATSSEEVLGKSNSDIKNHKTTYVTLLTLEKAEELMDAAYQETMSMLKALPIHADGIEKIISQMQMRKM